MPRDWELVFEFRDRMSSPGKYLMRCGHEFQPAPPGPPYDLEHLNHLEQMHNHVFDGDGTENRRGELECAWNSSALEPSTPSRDDSKLLPRPRIEGPVGK